MYALTICKIEKDTNRWAGLMQPLTLCSESDLINQLFTYDIMEYEFSRLDKGEKFYKEIEWKNYTVFIQYLRVS
jgi:hypothetical protein